MKAESLNNCFWPLLLCLLSGIGATAQSCALPSDNRGAGFRLSNLPSNEQPKNSPSAKVGFQTSKRFQDVLLPAWSADALPFFCRIEHQWSKNKATGFKFRLGSVDYVDWLEGKSHFATFAP